MRSLLVFRAVPGNLSGSDEREYMCPVHILQAPLLMQAVLTVTARTANIFGR